MSDDPLTVTPENSGDNKTAADESADKHKAKPKQKLNPPQRKPRKDSKLSKLEWGGFCADFYVTLWIWSDLIGCNERLRLVFLLSAVVVAHGVLCYFIGRLFGSWRIGGIAWIALCVAASRVAYKNIPRTADSTPAFIFSIANSESPLRVIRLTNDCFFPQEFENSQPLSGAVVFPIHIRQTNFVLNFRTRTTKYSQKSEFFVGLPAVWGVKPQDGWVPVLDEDQSSYLISSNGSKTLVEIQSWGFRYDKDLLPGDGFTLPGLLLTNVQQLLLNPKNNFLPMNGGVTIVAKAVGLPPVGLGFAPVFLEVTNGYSLTPVAMKLLQTNGMVVGDFMPPEKETTGNVK